MHNAAAISAIRQFLDPRFATLRSIRPYSVAFVSPVVSVALAAARLVTDRISECQFTPACADFAAMTGLQAAIAGKPLENKRSGLQGMTYSKLTHLRSHNDVEFCNAVIGDLIYGQLGTGGNARFVQEVVKVVGELHDNVPSHASGAGYSAAQVYDRQGRKSIEFAVADAGCGFLRNVGRIDESISTDAAAIGWCFARGNTTAVQHGDLAQRLPDDAIISPLPIGVDSFSQEDHHMGEGLWKLTELVNCCDGSLFVWSGDAIMTMIKGARSFQTASVAWRGVMIEMELPVESFRAATTDERGIEALAKRLGI